MAGLLDASDGSVIVIDRENRSMMVAQGSQICVGDRLATGANAKARLVFADGMRVMMRGNTSLRIEQFAWQESDPAQAKSELLLEDGSVRVVSGHLAKAVPEAFRLLTANAEIRVLGTDYDVTQVNQPRDQLELGTYASVNAGKIKVQNASGKLELNVGQSAAVYPNKAPQRVSLRPGVCVAQ